MKDYRCQGQITTTKTDYFIDAVDGKHVAGRGDSDVTQVQFDGVSMEVLPRNLYNWFRNVNYLAITNVANYPNFRRSDFYDFLSLEVVMFQSLPRVGQIPRDTFWDMEGMRDMIFVDMPNMENFDPDFLTRMFMLRLFIVENAPKITTIPAGFFRFQGGLETVQFSNTGLTTISYTAFLPTRQLKYAFFTKAGCIDNNYDETNIFDLTTDIRKYCKDDFVGLNRVRNMNNILKKKNKDYSSSSSSESQNKN